VQDWIKYDSFPQRNVIDSQIYIITAVCGPAVYRRPFTGRITTKKRVSDALLVSQEKKNGPVQRTALSVNVQLIHEIY